MPTPDEIFAALETSLGDSEEGKTALAELRSTFTSSTSEAQREATKAKNAAAQLKAERDRLKADLDAKGDVDERVKALSKERDEAIARATERESKLEAVRIQHALEAQFDEIGDRKQRRRAVEAFQRDYLSEGVTLDDSGTLQGVDDALTKFKTDESFWFIAPEKGHGGGRSGADEGPKAKKMSGAAAETAREAEIEAWKTAYSK